MTDDLAEERRMILRMLEEGRISPEQAVELLKALKSAGAGEGAGAGALGGAAGQPSGAGAAAQGVGGEPGERTPDLARWVEQIGNRVADLADEFAERVQRLFAAPGGVTERVGEAGERFAEVGERLQEVGRMVADRIVQAFGQVGTLAYPAFDLAEEFSGEFAEGAQPRVELLDRNGSITVRTDPAAGRTWRLSIRKSVRARTREEAESAGARLLAVTHGPSHLTVRAEGWLQGSADLELTLPAGPEVHLRTETANGSVTLRGIRASILEARSTNGRVDVGQVEAQRLLARSSNGTLVADGVSGGVVEVGSLNGSVTAALSGADVRVTTVNGSITLRPDVRPDGPAHQRVVAQALNGSVRVVLPAAVREAAQRQELGLALEAASSWGSARIDVPGTVLVTQTGQLGRQRVIYQTPHFDRAARTLRVEAETKTGSVAITAD